MKITKLIGMFVFGMLLTMGFGVVQQGYAQEDTTSSSDALKQLQEAAQDGQEAVAAPSEEEAKVESGETFDTPHDSDGN